MKKTMISTAVLALLFASCSSDDGLTQSTLPLEGTPIQVNVAVADLQTRAGYDNTNTPTEFFIDVINPNNGKYTYKDIKMIYENGRWKSYEYIAGGTNKPIQMLWAGDDNNVNVSASSFLIEDGQADFENFTNQTTEKDFKAKDHLLMKTTSLTPNKDGIDITFKHLMSKVELSIELRDEFYGSTTPTLSDVLICGSYPGFYSTDTDALQTDADYSQQNIKMFNIFSPTEIEKNHILTKYEAILFPQELAVNQLTISFKVGDRTFEWKSTDKITLESGKKYTLKLMAGHDKVSSASFSASNWGTTDQITGITE